MESNILLSPGFYYCGHQVLLKKDRYCLFACLSFSLRIPGNSWPLGAKQRCRSWAEWCSSVLLRFSKLIWKQKNKKRKKMHSCCFSKNARGGAHRLQHNRQLEQQTMLSQLLREAGVETRARDWKTQKHQNLCTQLFLFTLFSSLQSFKAVLEWWCCVRAWGTHLWLLLSKGK